MVNNFNFKTMRNSKKIYWTGIILFTVFLTRTGIAQETKAGITNQASIELLKAKSLWFNTSNCAGLSLEKMADYNNLLFDYNLSSGNFKRNSDGKEERNFGVSTEGGLNLGGGYVWGKFAYNNRKQTGTLYNTTMLDPSRGIPYFPVDKNLSDWVKQDYNLYMKVASKPLAEKIFLGLEAQYITSTGAKQVDPRSTSDFYTLNLKPGLAIKLNNQVAGFNFFYERLNQESSTTNSNSQANQDVFVMKGLGNFYTAVVGGLQSLGKFVYDGNKVGGAVQYSLGSKSFQMLLNGKYSFGVEDVTSSPSKPKKEGSLKENSYEANLQMVASGKNLSKVELTYSDNKNSGIEYVQVLDNSFNVQSWITTFKSIRSTFATRNMGLKYDFFRGNDFEYKWRAGLNLNYLNKEDAYILPASVMNIEDLLLGINAKANLNLNTTGRILAGLSLDYKANLDGKYVYGGADPGSHIITNYMTPDFNYLGMSYVKIGGELSYFTWVSINSKRTKGSGMFLKVAADYIKPSEGSDNRFFSNFGIGFTF